MSGEHDGARAVRIDAGDGKLRLMYMCPGCQDRHQVRIEDGWWTWNGDLDRPTFGGSVLVQGRLRHVDPDNPDGACHSYVTDGRAQFLGDCTHPAANSTLELPPWRGDA